MRSRIVAILSICAGAALGGVEADAERPGESDRRGAGGRSEDAGARCAVRNSLRYQQGRRQAGVGVVGHTDNVGQVASNVDLSKRRAEAVVRELVSRHNIAASHLQPEGVGPFAPVAPNSSDEGRGQNRRVELVAQ